MNRFPFVILCVLLILSSNKAGTADTSQSLPTIIKKTAGMKKIPGFFTLFWDAGKGKIWLAIDKWDSEFLYVNYLSRGVGSNDIGLDRGQIGSSRIVKFRKIGPKVLLIQPNYHFRAISNNPDEQKAVEESFAQSIIWGFEIAAQDKDRVLVDASAFFLRDAHDVIGVLKSKNQGDYALEESRSAINIERTKNFPKNTEVDVFLTFIGNKPGSLTRRVVPTPRAITVYQHHSFVELPDDKYKPRAFDVRAGFFGIQFMDYATPIGDPIVKRFIARHRLQKKDPAAKTSEAVKPIIYYVDRAAPEPIRSALIEGAQWWNQAFEAAGYRNAFQVKLLPEGADPLDIRYNVIQWVHRSTRGWSYGGTILDPRTGEIIKGHVTLGSLRVRQDYLIAVGLLAPYDGNKPVSNEMQKMALARLRQLSAHEVGHTLGLSHNFAASTANRASVMDYPHPYVKLTPNGAIDLSDAYTVGIGEWDKTTIRYGYQDFPSGTDEKKKLNDILNKSISQGIIYISDQDARPTGGAHPLAHLWDNGPNAIDELVRVMEIRAQVLKQFSERNIREGMPMATLENVLVPMYLFHRYQVEATAKLLGGLFYTYAVRGDEQKITEIVPGDEQQRALNALLSTLKPEVLALPEELLQTIPPRPIGYPRNRENFNTRTGLTFDPLAAAESAANIPLKLILHPERASRLIEYHARDKEYPGLVEVLEKLIEFTWKSPPKTGYFAEIQRVVDNLVLHHLMLLAVDETSSGQVRAVAFQELDNLKNWLNEQIEDEEDKNQQAHYLFAMAQIKQYQKNPIQFRIYMPLEPAAGPPIGTMNSNLLDTWYEGN